VRVRDWERAEAAILRSLDADARSAE
jgi:hypothetical protein